MSYRTLLVTLIVLATAGLVIGVSIEKADDHHDAPAAATSASESGETLGEHSEEAGEHSQEGEQGHADGGGEELHSEYKPLGINLESTPLIILAALGSLGLAALAWLRPRWLAGLGLVVLAMGAFSALDIAEVSHQAGIDEHGLAILAGLVAVLHLAAGFVALRMNQAARG